MAHRPAKPANDDNPGDPEEIRRTATNLITHFGSAAVDRARHMERESQMPRFARAVREEVERRLQAEGND